MKNRGSVSLTALIAAAIAAGQTVVDDTTPARGKKGKKGSRVKQGSKQGFVARLPEFARNREARQKLYIARKAKGLPTQGPEWINAKRKAGIVDFDTR